ncbi:MAG: RnfABCDGE type electron transport complex subunit B [Planctomycetota bacterium]
MELLKIYILTVLGMVFVQNFVLARFLGLCPFIGVSRRSSDAVGMGLAVTFVMALASVVTWVIFTYIMEPGSANIFYRMGLIPVDFSMRPILKVITYILVIASLVQFVEMFLRKTVPALYRSLGIYLPLITTNCAVLGVALLNTTDYFGGRPLSLLGALVQGVGAGLGFLLAMILMSAIRERLEGAGLPSWLRGNPIAFLATGLMAIAFLGFAGMISNDDMAEPKPKTPEVEAANPQPSGQRSGEGPEVAGAAAAPSGPEKTSFGIVASAAIALALLGGLLGGGLALASKAFHVEIDPREQDLTEALPGLNCGACGYAGCSGYAEAIARGTEKDLTLCKPGGPETVCELGRIMGQEVSTTDREVAVLHCHGVNVDRTYDYHGLTECDQAALLHGGPMQCKYGCIGLGTCARACDFQALVMGPDGLPVVIEENCVACGACVRACPKDLFELAGLKKTVHIRCASHDKGGVARKACKFACIACRKCEKICPVDAITIEDNLAIIDYDKCIACGKCVGECPDDTIANFRQERKRYASK